MICFMAMEPTTPGAEAQWLVISVLTAAGIEKITGETRVSEQQLASINAAVDASH